MLEYTSWLPVHTPITTCYYLHIIQTAKCKHSHASCYLQRSLSQALHTRTTQLKAIHIDTLGHENHCKLYVAATITQIFSALPPQDSIIALANMHPVIWHSRRKSHHHIFLHLNKPRHFHSTDMAVHQDNKVTAVAAFNYLCYIKTLFLSICMVFSFPTWYSLYSLILGGNYCISL